MTATRPVRTYRGSCHCGAVAFEIDTDFPELTTCDCSICRRKNALMVRVHESRFRLLSGEDSLTEYRFHTMTARHFFCRKCGIYPFHRKRVTPDPAWFDAITAACIAFEQNAARIVADYRTRVRDMPMTERLDFEIKVA